MIVDKDGKPYPIPMECTDEQLQHLREACNMGLQLLRNHVALVERELKDRGMKSEVEE